MNIQQLETTAQAMVAPGKGILAMDESTPTCTQRFHALGIESTLETRHFYRSLLLTTPGLPKYIAGAILYDETFRQEVSNGTSFPQYLLAQGMLPGIKVDMGAMNLANHPGEKVTEGLDGLRGRLMEYVELGARFTKWRAVITIGNVGCTHPRIPTRGCIEANAHALARYAALVQEAGLVPIVEPEVLITGDHTIERCYEVTLETLKTVFFELHKQRVHLEGMVLKPSMVIAGLDCPQQASVEQVAELTVRCLLNTVPATVAGVAFLSGGQTDEQATASLNAMNQMGGTRPWPLTFSYARVLQGQPLQIWRGNPENKIAAQQALVRRAGLVSAAAEGNYDSGME